MAGIEEAFEKFVTRVSSGEEPQSEYGDPQTGEKRIPIMQGIKRGYDFENTMPNYYNQRYGYENEMPIYNNDRYSIPQQELAYGGVASMFRERSGYAEGGKPTREDSPILQINPMERDIQFSQDPTMEQMPNVGIAAIGLTKKAKDYNRYIKAFESNDPKVFKKWFDSQTKEFSKTKKLAEDAEMFELIPEVARGASKTQKQLANNQLRESMGRYYAQELGPYYSQEIGILDNLIFKAYGGRVSMSDGGLTTTVPPDKGPDSQGVESLFRRRYS
jgi:hypothetical protein